MEYLYLELFKVGGQVHAQFIERWYFNNLKAEHGRGFTLQGQKVTQFFITRDNTIRNQDAADFIERYQKKRVVFHRIDLSQLGRFPEVKNK